MKSKTIKAPTIIENKTSKVDKFDQIHQNIYREVQNY